MPSWPTHVRDHIFICASLGRYGRTEEAEWAAQYNLNIDSLPQGALIGTVELYDCYGEEWQLRAPQRLAKPVKPDRHPQPVWFRPFG